jgi:integrase
MRQRERLSAAKIPHLEPGRYHDGGGLYLQIDRGRGNWTFRYRSRVTGKLRDKGLGALADVSLAIARKRAHACRLQLLDGIDPIEAARERLEAQRVANAKTVTFGKCAERYIEAHKGAWSNAKHAAQWTSTLDTYAAPLRSLPVASIDTGLVLQCLEPEWSTKHETMTRVRQRIECVMDWATARKYRTGENPARWRGHLDKLLPAIAKKKRVRPRPALPYVEIGTFMAALRKRQGMGARCLELQILTATRPGEAAGAQWDEIDLDAKVWTIPAERMKARVVHRVPLSDAAVSLLKSLPHIDSNVFPGVNGNPITPAAPEMVLKKMHAAAVAAGDTGYMDPLQNRPIVPHGFRSCFRDWAGDRTAFPREVAEAALAHTVKGVEGDYRRGDAFRKRTKLMAAWADYCAAAAGKGSVTQIRRKAS